MAAEKSKLENLMEAIRAADDELFKRLKVPSRYQTPGFAQMIREAVHEPPRRLGLHDKLKISPEPGPRYRTPVSPERMGPPAPYEYIGDELEREMPRTSTSTASWQDRPKPLHHSGFDGKPFDFGKQRELELRAMGHTPDPYYKKGISGYGYSQLDPMRRPTDTLFADPRNYSKADAALHFLRQAGLRER